MSSEGDDSYMSRMMRRMSSKSRREIEELAGLGFLDVGEAPKVQATEKATDKFQVETYNQKVPPIEWMDGFPAPPPVPDETKEAWKKTAFLVSQVGSRLDSAHRIRKTSETKVYPNTARGRQQLEEDLLKLPVSYIGGGWWSLYDTKWCRPYFCFNGYPPKTTWTPPASLERMLRLFNAVMKEDIRTIQDMMDEEVDVLAFVNSAGYTALEVAIKNKKAKVLNFFRRHDITESRLRELRGGTVKDDSSDYNFGKFGKFQEKYMFHNKAQRLFNLAMESSTNYTNSKRVDSGKPRMSTYIP